MTSQWASLCLKSPVSRMFAQPFVQALIKENLKAPRQWPLWGNPPVTCGSPHTGPVTRKCFHLMLSSWKGSPVFPWKFHKAWKKFLHVSRPIHCNATLPSLGVEIHGLPTMKFLVAGIKVKDSFHRTTLITQPAWTIEYTYQYSC